MATTQTPPQAGKPLDDLLKRMSRAHRTANTFWQRVSEGFELHDLWAQFKAEAQASYGLYAQEVDWKALESESRFRRAVKLSNALFMAMLMKLTPARRVMLLLAIVLLAIGRVTTQGENVRMDFNFAPLGVAILFLLLAMELADRVTMKRDLEIAREIQHWLVPAAPPIVPGADIAFSTRPANTVAGDYYDAFFRDSGRLLLVVADVAGKSVPAALLMATLQASLQALAAATESLEELVVRLNRYACVHSLGGMRFTTAFLAELDVESRALTYICAGHNAPILQHANGGIDRLDAGGVPLGIDATARYDSGKTTLAAGDLLVIFTDGLVEAFNERGEEFGEPRLIDTLRALSPRSAAETQKQLMSTMESFVGATRQHDDITCLILRAQ